MAHYNLYDSLNLDINASSDDIVSILEKRIQEGNLDNLGGLEEDRKSTRLNSSH